MIAKWCGWSFISRCVGPRAWSWLGFALCGLIGAQCNTHAAAKSPAENPEWTFVPAYVTPAGNVKSLSIVDDQGNSRTLYSNSYAILILEGNYGKATGFAAVQAVAAKAERLLKDRLEARGFRVLIWKDLPSKQLKAVLAEVFEQFGYETNSRLFFYYFGHGYTVSDPDDSTHDRTFLVPTDVTNPVKDEQKFEREAFPITQMIQYASQGTLKHTFFAFEACKAGAIVSSLGGPSPLNVKGYLLNPGILSEVHQFLTAGNNVQDVPADNSFTALLAAALSDPDADSNKDGYITGKELMDYIVLRLPQWKEYPSSPEVGWRPLGSTGDFVFGPVTVASPAKVSAPKGGELASAPGQPTVEVGRQDASTKIAEAGKRHRDAIQLLGDKAQTPLTHVAAISELADVAKAAPELAPKIAEELALAALTYSTPHRGGKNTQNIVGEISPETQAALKEIGGLAIMTKGLPLQLQVGNFRGAKLPAADLNGVDLSGSDLTGSDLYAARLYNVNLPYSVLSGANLAGALLSHAAFYGALLCPDHNTAVPALAHLDSVPVQLSGAKMDDVHF